MTEETKSWHYCYKCGYELYGKPSDDDMNGITVMKGICPRCGKEELLIPVVDFTGKGD